MKQSIVEKVLDFVETNGTVRYTDILHYYTEVIYGGKYDWRTARGCLSHHMCRGFGFFKQGYFLHPAFKTGRTRWLSRVGRGLYEVKKY